MGGGVGCWASTHPRASDDTTAQHTHDVSWELCLPLSHTACAPFLQVLGSHHDSGDGQLPHRRPGRRQQRAQVSLGCPLAPTGSAR